MRLKSLLPRSVPQPVDVERSLGGRAALVRFDAHGDTRQGPRESNQDQYAVLDLFDGLRVRGSSLPGTDNGFSGRHGQLLAVADGIGGSPGGADASRLALETVVHRLGQHDHDDRGGSVPQELERAVAAAQRAIVNVARSRPDLRRMGTTLTAALVLWPRAWLVHVGDSRAYLFRRGRLRQLTSDHTVAERLRAQLGSPDEVDLARWEGVLTNALSAEAPAEPESLSLVLEPGDALLLCSDGLTDVLADEEIERTLAEGRHARSTVEALLATALVDGGVDNTTVALSRYR